MWMPIIVAMGVAVFLGAAGGVMTPIGVWYRQLRKPRWQPPDWAFGPAWTILLGLAAWAAIIAWRAADDSATRRAIVIMFAVNALCHFLWSPLFFRLRRPDWALVEVVFLWVSLIVLVVGLWPISHAASVMIMPYLAWVSFAAILNATIVRLNGPFARG